MYLLEDWTALMLANRNTYSFEIIDYLFTKVTGYLEAKIYGNETIF